MGNSLPRLMNGKAHVTAVWPERKTVESCRARKSPDNEGLGSHTKEFRFYFSGSGNASVATEGGPRRPWRRRGTRCAAELSTSAVGP